MAESDQMYGGLNTIELGAVIIASGIAAITIIILINVCVYKCRKEEKSKRKYETNQQMVGIQTQRTVGGQNMEQVIVRSSGNNNVDKQNHDSMPYRTMDTETNTVRYDTAQNSMIQQGEVTLTFHQEGGMDTTVITKPENYVVEESGEMTTDVHIGIDNQAFEEDDHQQGAEEPRVEEDRDSEIESPTYHDPALTYYEPPLPTEEEDDDVIPPPPQTGPPPLTPSADLDDHDSMPLPPLVDSDGSIPIYASLNKRPTVKEESQSFSLERSGSMWQPRDESEIQIIEKAKF